MYTNYRLQDIVIDYINIRHLYTYKTLISIIDSLKPIEQPLIRFC